MTRSDPTKAKATAKARAKAKAKAKTFQRMKKQRRPNE
jgi:hypothetical protein